MNIRGGNNMSNPKVVLAYSGGLDTSVAINWIKDQGYDVVACCLDVGEGKDLDFIRKSSYCWSRRILCN